MNIKKILFLVLSVLFLLVGCKQIIGKPTCNNHIDNNGDGFCDVCEETMPILPIEIKDFENLSFSDKQYTYDGEYHSIEVVGVPSFATVSYTNNNQKEIGRYKVTATISAEGYNTKILTAYLVIKERKFSGITFENQEIPYDGEYHSIEVEGAPINATITYSGNNQKEVGTYTVSATISMNNYETLRLSATLKIVESLPLIESLVDRELFYTGFYQPIIFTYPSDLRYGVSAIYKVDGIVVDEDKFAVKDIGEHFVSITLKDSYYKKLADRTTTAKVNVLNSNFVGIDSSKTAFTIDNNTKYKELRSEILKGNFTLKVEYFDDYDRDKDGVYEESIISISTMIYFANNKMFYLQAYQQDYVGYSEYKIAKIENDNVIISDHENSPYGTGYSGKMPKTAWEENFVARYGLASIAYLSEDSDGKFKNGEEGGYSTSYGTYSIDSVNNLFIEDVNTYNFHNEWNHSEHTRYTLYNIGNTLINIDICTINYNNLENLEYLDNGITYYLIDNSYEAYLDFDSITLCYLEPKEYIIPAYYNGLPVLSFSQDYYYKYYHDENKMKGYTFKLYINSLGYYQGEYIDLEYVSNYRYIFNIENDGATILFYDDWNK